MIRALLVFALLGGMAFSAHAQIFKLPPADTVAGNFFGVAVAIDGDRALIGASGEDLCGANSGAAYIYERDTTGTWAQVAKLHPRDCVEGHFFGRTLALSGNRAVVAAFRPFFSSTRSNAAYVFERDTTGTWSEVARLTAGEGFEEGPFAASVALDGDRALITTAGDRGEGRHGGAAYVFERDPLSGFWRQQARVTGSGSVRDGIFGTSAALDGDRFIVSASTYFAERPGSAYIFERKHSGTWQETAHLTGIEDFFISVDIHGDHVIVGESKGGKGRTGIATLYQRQPDSTWVEEAELLPRTPYRLGAFGTLVALHGNHAMAVGYDEQLQLEFNIDRVVYLFHRDPETDTWKQLRTLDVGEVAFGSAIALDGIHALIGQASEQDVGLAYIVKL